MKLFIAILTIVLFIPVFAGTSAETIKKIPPDKVKDNSFEIQQTQIDSVNISQMVQEQIDAARKKSFEVKIRPVLKAGVKKNNIPKKSEAGIWPEFIKEIPFSNGAFIKVSIILIFASFVFGTIFFRRFFTQKSKPKNKKDITSLKRILL